MEFIRKVNMPRYQIKRLNYTSPSILSSFPPLSLTLQMEVGLYIRRKFFLLFTFKANTSTYTFAS